MKKQKTLYDKLVPEIKAALRKNAKEYNGAKMLKYNLMSKLWWWDLNIEEIKQIFRYTDLSTWKYEYDTFLYGEKIIEKE